MKTKAMAELTLDPDWTDATRGADLLYHGSSQEIRGPLHGGGYDHMLWTADCSAVAQSYIPASGLKAYVQFPWWRQDSVRPEDIWLTLAEQLGYTATVTKDTRGRVQSWSWAPSWPTYDDLEAYLGVLGYQAVDGVYCLKETCADGRIVVLPAAYRLPGTLTLLQGREKLRILDIAEGHEFSLMDPDYHQISLFEAAQSVGYDAIRICDACQSPMWGNVEHTSIGLLPSGIALMTAVTIPAVHFDWPDGDGRMLSIRHSPEFLAWSTETDG